MSKPVHECLGAAAVIAAAGIWISGASGMAHADTGSVEATSSSTGPTGGVTDSGNRTAPTSDADNTGAGSTSAHGVSEKSADDNAADIDSATGDDKSPTQDDSRHVDADPEQSDTDAQPADADSIDESGRETAVLPANATPRSASSARDAQEKAPDGAVESESSSVQNSRGTGVSAKPDAVLRTAAAKTVTNSTTATDISAPLAAKPAVAEPVAAAVSTEPVSNPVVTLLAGVLSFFGLNRPEPPADPLGALVWGFFRQIETVLGVVPRTAQTTIGEPAETGTVTGTVEFEDNPALPLTYTATLDPNRGVVTVNPDGTFTYTPTAAARLAAGAPGADPTVAFIVTATNGLAATNTTVMVPLRPFVAGSVVATIPVSQWVSSVTVSPDGSYAYVTAIDTDPETGAGTGATTVQVIDLATNTVQASIPVGSQPFAVAFTLDGAYAYVTLADNAVAVIDTATHNVVTTIPVQGAPSNVAFTPDGAYAYVVDIHLGTNGFPFGHVAVINTATNSSSGEIPVQSRPFGLAIAHTARGTFAYVTDSFSGTVSVIDTGINIIVNTFHIDGDPNFIALSPDQTRVYVGVHDVVGGLDVGSVQVIDTATNAVVGTIPVGSDVSGLVVSPDGRYVYLAARVGGQNVFRVIDTATSAVIGESTPIGRVPYTVAVGADGSLVYIANAADGTVSVIYTGNWSDF